MSSQQSINDKGSICYHKWFILNMPFQIKTSLQTRFRTVFRSIYPCTLLIMYNLCEFEWLVKDHQKTMWQWPPSGYSSSLFTLCTFLSERGRGRERQKDSTKINIVCGWHSTCLTFKTHKIVYCEAIQWDLYQVKQKTILHKAINDHLLK